MSALSTRSAAAGVFSADHPFAAAFEGTEVGFFLAASDGTLVRTNKALCELVGLPHDAAGAVSLLDCVHPDYAAEIRQALMELQAGTRRRFGGELQLLPADGAPVWVEAGISAVERDGDTSPVLIGQVRDISARRKTEEALRESEAFFRAAFDDAAVAMLVVAADGSISRTNAAFRDLLGYEAKDVEGLDVLLLTHPDDRDDSRSALSALQRGERREFSIEKRYLRRDGEVVWGRLAVAPVCLPSGHVRSLVAQIIDLTAIRRAEQQFRMVFDAAGIGISIGADGMLTETNAAYQRLFGYAGEELARMHYTDICHPDDANLDAAEMDDLLAGRKSSFTVEKRYVRRDGEVAWVRVTVTMAPDGSFGIGLIEDISERRRLLGRTVEAAEAERVALAADLHDGPIQHLAASAFDLDRLAQRLSRAGEIDGAQFARRIRDNVSAEMASLRQMMSALRPPAMDERGLDAAIRDLADAVLHEAGVEYTVESNLRAGRLAPELETAIFRVVREAVTNIRKHAVATRVEICLDAHDDTIYLSVTDDGVGFDPMASKPAHYGLVGMRERVESLGGTLVITAGASRGARIQASLPIKT